MKNSDWYVDRGGILSLFFGLCWLNLVGCGLWMVLTLLQFIAVNEHAICMRRTRKMY